MRNDEDTTAFGQADVVRLTDEDAVATLVTGAVRGLWEVVNQLTRLHRTRRDDYRVTIFGSARLAPGTFAYDAVKRFVGEVYEHRTFFSRPYHFMIVSDAFVVVPGGIGRLLGLSLVWQLLQARKLHNVPLILVGDMRGGLVDWARTAMLREDAPLADGLDFTIPRCVRTVDETVAILRGSRAEWLAAGAAP